MTMMAHSSKASTEFSWAPYTPEFYDAQVTGRESVEVRALAEAIWFVLRPSKVMDIGCGRGAFLHRLAEIGCETFGTDGALALALKPFGPSGKPAPIYAIQDFRDVPVILPRGFDAALCLEVVEHLPSEDADRLVRTICRSGVQTIVFSGAQPGQTGTGHINERPLEHWDSVFRGENRISSPSLRYRILETWRGLIGRVERCWWYERNLRVYQ